MNKKKLKFSNNSRYLLFVDIYGCLGCFAINKNYKLIYQSIIKEYILEVFVILYLLMMSKF